MLRPVILVALSLAASRCSLPSLGQTLATDHAFGGTWRLVEFDDTPAGHGETINVGHETISAKTACNIPSGPLSVRCGEFRIARLAVTRLPCKKDGRPAERRLSGAPGDAKGYTVEAGALTLIAENGRV